MELGNMTSCWLWPMTTSAHSGCFVVRSAVDNFNYVQIQRMKGVSIIIYVCSGWRIITGSIIRLTLGAYGMM